MHDSVVYYKDKGNFFNAVFVKKGWFWTILVYTCFFLTQILFRRKVYIGSVLRISAVTGWWYIFTQSFFGLPIMDRVFIATGGGCSDVDLTEKFSHLSKLFRKVKDSNLAHSTQVSSWVCRKVGGTWDGGHDPSGHIFLLTLSSFVLLRELAIYKGESSLMKLIVTELKRTKKLFRTLQVKNWKAALHFTDICVFWLCVLWVWMIFTTSIFYHSVFEKLTGLVWSYAGIYAVYEMSGIS